MKSKIILGRTIVCLVSLLLILTSNVHAEDIDIYVKDIAKQKEIRPKVLIIFDNSGSMRTLETVKEYYDHTKTYPAVAPFSALSEDYIYYKRGTSGGNTFPIADSTTESRRFISAINSCKSAQDILNVYGFYTGHIRQYVFEGNTGRWEELSDYNGSEFNLIDCENDLRSSKRQNHKIKGANNILTSVPNGYPIDGEGDKENPQYYTDNRRDSNAAWAGPSVTLYTANYLRWHQSQIIATKTEKRISIAKESVVGLINSTPFVDFGLQIFNLNNGRNNRNGGRVIYGIKDSSDVTKSELTNIVNSLHHRAWTPICESLYEASRYFGGKTVDYGDDWNTYPHRDQSIESSGTYISPMNECSDKIYVIIITDGEPAWDIDADAKIIAMPQVGQDPMGPIYNISHDNRHDRANSYLPSLAGWLNNNDVNPLLEGKQVVETYTIGFGQDAKNVAEALLIETASRGGGKYFYAQDTASLTGALTNVLANLKPTNNSLTSASVAPDRLDLTKTLNSTYYAMFQPNRSARWQGNLKKYKIINGVEQGSSGIPAIASDGFFSQNTTSYWSTSQDGADVVQGGVAEMLRSLTKRRKIYSDLGKDSSLKDLVYGNVIAADAFGSRTALAQKLGVIDDQETIKSYLQWTKGFNVDDASIGNADPAFMRPDVFGDPLHSKPVVINYGDGNIYIALGTNQGALHMFKDDDSNNAVTEAWAFMPKDLFSNIKKLRDNFPNTKKVYGVDGRITLHFDDKDGDGIVGTGDKVWLFFGLRRGGDSYYGLDVTDPEDPKMLWHIKGGSEGFEELGQTWSQPKVAYSKLNKGHENEPVLIFGGGYAIKKDSDGIGGAKGSDNIGKAIYMVNAKDGKLLWSLAPAGTTTFTGVDSIPSRIATLDSDGDGFTDRLYAGDTGGNVWRVDMPNDEVNNVSAFKLADLGGSGSHAVDRRFFSEPAIVRAIITETSQVTTNGLTSYYKKDIPYDAILLGSGDRTSPLSTDTDDIFYMIKDNNIRTKNFTGNSAPKTITITDLYNYTDNPFKDKDTFSDTKLNTLSFEVSQKSGWYMNLVSDGEKSTSRARVFNNVVYFTSYVPPVFVKKTCNIPQGKGYLYAVDLSLGINKHVNNDDKPQILVSNQFLDTPTLIVTEVDHDNDPNTPNVDKPVLKAGNTDVDLSNGSNNSDLFKTSRTYLYVDEE